jgi:hypothetical protein
MSLLITRYAPIGRRCILFTLMLQASIGLSLACVTSKNAGTFHQIAEPVPANGGTTSPPSTLRDEPRERLQAEAPPDAPYWTSDLPALLSERPKRTAVGAFFYDGIRFGEIGKRIITVQQEADVNLLREALICKEEETEVTTASVFEHGLPLRSCDYALLIAERLLGGVAGNVQGHLFGPSTPYEYRDLERRRAFLRLFGETLQEGATAYRYLDDNGRDVSLEYRKGYVHP